MNGRLLAGIVVAVLALAAPWVAYPVFLMTALCFALFACAFNLMLGYVGLLSFGHAAYFGAGAYTTMLLMQYRQVPPWFGVWAGMAVVVVVFIPISAQFNRSMARMKAAEDAEAWGRLSLHEKKLALEAERKAGEALERRQGLRRFGQGHAQGLVDAAGRQAHGHPRPAGYRARLSRHAVRPHRTALAADHGL